MAKAIRMSRENLALIVSETNDDLDTHEGNMEYLTDLHGEVPYVLISGSKAEGNLVTTWWCKADLLRNWKFDAPESDTKFVQMTRIK